MEIVIAAALVVLVPIADKLIKIAGDRSRARGEAEVIHANGMTDLARAPGAAQVIKAQVQPPAPADHHGVGTKDHERA
ncbi:hypothetical protein [Streptomyces sp. NPDC050848]|uniref:hypothetical protein n=1 Tax=Streptomyces sp. NPDC050848 TaxID=3155791 RepID=UPI0033E945E7